MSLTNLFIILTILCVAAALVIAGGEMRWRSGTRAMRARLEVARVPTQVRFFDAGELERLPAPVRCYLNLALVDRQRIVEAATVEQTGKFNLSESADQWKRFTATQRVITHRPGFDWDARITMVPGVWVRVHDAYVAGEGTLHAAIFGLFSKVNQRGTGELARGELMRFFAEAPWYPTALLSSQGVVWDAVDDHSARATFSDGDITLSLLFGFSDDGLIETMRAESRVRTAGVAAQSMPWQGRFWNYAVRDGMRVPLEAEVEWLTPEGAKPYWRGKITSLIYEFAR